MKLDTKTPLHIQASELAKKHNLTHAQYEQWNNLIKSAYIQGSDANFSILKPIIDDYKEKINKIKQLLK
jgi:hypothetical protein